MRANIIKEDEERRRKIEASQRLERNRAEHEIQLKLAKELSKNDDSQ